MFAYKKTKTDHSKEWGRQEGKRDVPEFQFICLWNMTTLFNNHMEV